MTVHNSSFAAEYARGPVVVEASGKSGGSQVHGGAYMYARNGVMNAEDASLKANNVAKPNDSQYYPGGNIGGPVILPGLNYNKNHDKLFFFAGYEYMKQQPEGNLVHLFVPTADMLGQNPNKPYADFTPAYLQSLRDCKRRMARATQVPLARQHAPRATTRSGGSTIIAGQAVA